MRKHATALAVTALFTLASGSALAMGDRHKEKKATSDTATTTQSTPSSNSGYTSPTGNAPGASTSMKTDNTGAPSGATATSPGSMGAAADTTDKKKQVARNDPKCDESKVARDAMPKDCFEKSGTGAASVGSTQNQSGK